MTLQATHTKEVHDNRDMHLYLLNYFFFSLESHKPGLTPQNLIDSSFKYTPLSSPWEHMIEIDTIFYN